jgi:DeoR family transcriptional regulator, suf operon transcriptional repressor
VEPSATVTIRSKAFIFDSVRLPEDRITALVETMQALGYHATEEQNAPTPSIRAFNCVYHDLAQQFPELCEFDRALMSALLNRPIEQTECMARNDCSCKFIIKNN